MKIYIGNFVSYLIVSFFIATFTSCEPSPEDKVREIQESWLLDNLDDPRGYEFVSVTLLDTITREDNLIQKIIRVQELAVIENMKYIQRLENDIERHYSSGGVQYGLYADNSKSRVERRFEIARIQEKKLEKAKISLVKNETRVKNMEDRLISSSPEKLNGIDALKFLFKFRLPNSSGRQELFKIYILTKPGPNYELIDRNTDESKLPLIVNYK